ncbi:MAG: hypothetical protein RXR82_06105 [Nitrososphaeria archaeon]
MVVVSSTERSRAEERERRGSQERREAEGREEPTRREPPRVAPEPPTKREASAAAAAAARPAPTIPRFVGRDPPRLSASLSLAQGPPRVAPAPAPAVVRFAGAIPLRVSASPRLEGGLPSPPPAPPPIPVRAVALRAPSLSARAIALAAELPGPPAVPGPPPVRFSPAPAPALAASEARLESSLPIVPPRPARAQAMEERAQAQSAAPSQLQGEAPGGGGEELQEPPEDFLEWILGGYAGRIGGERPYAILYEEYEEEGRRIPSNTIGLLEEVLARRYREIRGGAPKPEIVDWPEVRGGLEGLPSDLNPEGRIFRLVASSLLEGGYSGGKFEKEEQEKELRGRAARFLHGVVGSRKGSLGFFVVWTRPGRRDWEATFVEDIENELGPELIKLKAGILGKLDLRRRYDLLCELAELASGINARELEKRVNSLSECISWALWGLERPKGWDGALAEVVNDESIYFQVTNEGSNESERHFELKVLTVKYVVERDPKLLELAKSWRLDELRKIVRTEQEEAGGTNPVIPDVAIGDERYEVETLFGESPVGKKVQESIEKYRGRPMKVTVVLEALAALMHHRTLEALLRSYHKNPNFEASVRIAVPFLIREGGRWRVELMDLDEHWRRLQDLRRRMEEAARASDH